MGKFEIGDIEIVHFLHFKYNNKEYRKRVIRYNNRPAINFNGKIIYIEEMGDDE